jgi:hypothetical protein
VSRFFERRCLYGLGVFVPELAKAGQQFGMSALPFNFAVEIDLIVEVE